MVAPPPQRSRLAGLVAHAGDRPRRRAAVAGRALGPSGSSTMVTLDNLTVSYRQHPAFHHVSGHFAPSFLTAVVGPNGSGRSTLLKSIVGLLPVAGWQLTVAVPAGRAAYLPQIADIERNFPIDVRDCVLGGCWPLKRARGSVDAVQLQRVDAALADVGLQGFERRPIGSLSSGQLQRVLFARLLVQNADLMLLDEPFNAIDSKTTTALLALIARWHQNRQMVIVVLHNDAQVLQHFPQSLLLARELVALGPTEGVMTQASLTIARAMAEVWDEDADMCEIDAPTSSPARAAVPAHPQKAAA